LENTTRFTYDPATCNLSTVTDPLNRVTRLTYFAGTGNVQTVTDDENRVLPAEI